MVDRIGVKGPYDAHVVGALGRKFRPQFRYPLSRRPPLLEWMLGCETIQFLALELSDLLPLRYGIGHGLTVQFGEFGLVIERFQVGHASGHVKPDDAFCFGRMM